MSDRLREAGTLVAHLRRALLDGFRDLSTVPTLIKRLIADDMWRERVDPPTARALGRFRSFDEFAGTPAAKGGLGSSVRQLKALCKDDKAALTWIDSVTGSHQGHRSDLNLFDNIQEVKAPTGTSESAALRRLRKSAPELHADVLAGRLSAHAAMVQAGFRPKTITVPVTRPDVIARTLRKHMSAEDITKLAAHLSANPPDGTA